MRYYLLTLALGFTAAGWASSSSSCGSELRDVKLLADKPAIDLSTPKDATIAQLIALSRPNGVLDQRVKGAETTFFRIKARLTNYKRETDSDYHLVLEDDQGSTMIAEIPSPDCADQFSSPVATQIAAARSKFDKTLKATSTMKETDVPVTVTGVGFFDVPHGGAGQLGHAANNIEIHPVLSIVFEATPPDHPSTESDESPASFPAAGGGPAETADQQLVLPKEPAPPSNLYTLIFIIMTVLYIGFFAGTVMTLRRAHDWSLGAALSEKGKPSSSRLIAFLGLLALLAIYVGFGYAAVWRVLNGEPIPDVKGFLLSGLAVFAPYIANQVKQMMGGGGSQTPQPGGGGGDAAGGAGGGTPKPKPRVFTVTPNSVSPGVSTQITVAGSGFDPKATVVVTTPGSPVTPTISGLTVNQMQLGITMPSSATSYVAVVHITNPDGAEATGTFQVTAGA